MKKVNFTEDERNFINQLQIVINRLSEQSAKFKQLVITILIALYGVDHFSYLSDDYRYLGFVIIAIFFVLDLNCLKSEKAFRNLETTFIYQIKEETENESSKLYDFDFRSIKNYSSFKLYFSALSSFSIGFFYLMLCTINFIYFAIA